MENKKIDFAQLLINDCNGTIEKLEALKKDLDDKNVFIVEQNITLDQRIKNLSEKIPTLKVDQNQRQMFQSECDNYRAALTRTMRGIDTEIDSFKKLVEEVQKNGFNEKSFVIATIKIQNAKLYSKKIQKESTVGHSKFRFSLDMQNKQLNYLETEYFPRTKH